MTDSRRQNDRKEPVRILIVDDDELVRHALHLRMERCAGYHVVGQAADGSTAVQAAVDTRPDVIIMDVVMPDVGGAHATREVLMVLPDCQVIGWSGFSSDDQVLPMIEAGAIGYVTKTCDFQSLAAAVNSAVAGHSYMCPCITSAAVWDCLAQRNAARQNAVHLSADGAEQLVAAYRDQYQFNHPRCHSMLSRIKERIDRVVRQEQLTSHVDLAIGPPERTEHGWLIPFRMSRPELPYGYFVTADGRLYVLDSDQPMHRYLDNFSRMGRPGSHVVPLTTYQALLESDINFGLHQHRTATGDSI